MALLRDRSFSELLQDIVANIQYIMRSELRLAKTEVREEIVKARGPMILLGIGFLTGIFALFFLLLAIVYALQLVMAAWLAALIVGVIAGASAASLAIAGKNGLKRVHVAPDKTIHTLKENVQWARHQAR